MSRQIPHSQAISPYDPQAPKIRLSFRRDQRVQFHRSPTNPVKQTSWTCVTVRQTNPQPVPANHLRYLSCKFSAGQFQQMLHACDGGGGAVTIGAHVFTGMRTLSCLHGCAHTFTGMLTSSRARARPWHPGTLLPRPAYGSHRSSANPAHSNALRLRNISADLRVQPAYSKALGGMGMASPRDAATAGAPRSSPPEGRRLRPRAWIPEESGQAGFNKSPQARRRGNRIRRTNDRSRRPSARPGVTHAPRRRGAVSLPFRVSLAAFC